jgi:hypothetical protein
LFIVGLEAIGRAAEHERALAAAALRRPASRCDGRLTVAEAAQLKGAGVRAIKQRGKRERIASEPRG